MPMKPAEFVCPECFGDESLRARVLALQTDVDEQTCDVHREQAGVSIDDVAKIVDPVFRQNYGLVSQDWDELEGDGLESCLSELAQIEDDAVAQGLAKGLIDVDPYWPPDGGQPFYGDTEIYRRGDYTNSEHSELWERFCRGIIYGQRFFNSMAKDLLDKIFSGVEYQRNENGGKPLSIMKPGTDSSFYRARVARDGKIRREISMDVALYLGPPPERLRRAGRMNPAGIAVFYGAFDLRTCIAELRPAVGDVVVGAKFETTEPLCVLDLTQFQKPQAKQGLFDKNQVEQTAQWQFMTRFMREISRPVSSVDEHLDYIPTQAVAEWLLHHFDYETQDKKIHVEAIIYSSAQFPFGKNIAILGEAARAGLLDGDKPKRTDADRGSVAPDLNFLFGSDEFRLAAKPQTLEARIVSGASFSTEDFFDGTPFELGDADVLF